jgi:allantoinase
MSWQQQRDFIGYGAHPPNPQWPGEARLALNFVLNYEEGSEPSIQDEDGFTENRLTESSVKVQGRDLAAEGMFEYGSRVGFWRVHREFESRQLPLTIFGCALALERNPDAATAIREAGYDICCHGYRWVNHTDLDEATERRNIELAVESLERTIGAPPKGWYCRYGPSVNTRRLLVEHGGFLYDSDAYNDELPYWCDVDGTRHLVVPYSMTTNDAKYLAGIGSGDQWFTFLRDSFDVLYREGAEAPKMMSVGLHPRIIGHPGRFAGLLRFLDHVQQHDDVWIAPRVSIAEHWMTTHP